MSEKLKEFYSKLDLDGSSLAHWGIKGMKWGIRNDVRAVSSGVLNSEGQLTNQSIGVRQGSPIPTASEVKVLQEGLSRAYDGMYSKECMNYINKLNESISKDFDASGNWNDSAQKLYDSKVAQQLESSANKKLSGTGLVSYVTGTHKAYLIMVGQSSAIEAIKLDTIREKKSLRHSLEFATISGTIIPTLNDKGLVIGFERGKIMKHSNEVEEFISHWGIKGMRWGVRRSDAELARLSGGQTESDDAARARRTQESISKAKSLSAVSDADLNHLVNRINVEKRYVDAKAAASSLTKAHSKIKTILNVGDTMNKAIQFSNSDAGKYLRKHLTSRSK